jgi:putative solute:sodium symporter small subunit
MPPEPNDPRTTRAAYWRKNRRLIAFLLAIWALVSFGFAILFPGTYPIGQLPAGFWWAQQGSMFVFVILIFVYAWRMDRIDREFDLHEMDEPDEPGPPEGE